MKRLLLTVTGVALTSSFVIAQTQAVRGVIVDASTGEPIIGANVIVKGHTSVGVTTNLEGKFSLNAPKGASHLLVSFIGYQKKEVAIKPNLKISLETENSVLDDVIVVAFGTAKKSSFTGSATVVDNKALSKMQVSNVTRAFEGKVPGLYVTSKNNQPGSSASILIRGEGSFSAKSAPLYVVDGVPFDGDIASINPTDIESTTILKDASSAALYGARGANGVILISTKTGKGKVGKLNINFDARFGVNQRGIASYDYLTDPKVYAARYYEGIYYYQLLDKEESPEEARKKADAIFFSKDKAVTNLAYLPFRTDLSQDQWFEKDNKGHFYMHPSIKVGVPYKVGDQEYYLQPDDWAFEVYRTNPRQEYNLSVSGRSDKANYFFSAGYLGDNGYIVSSSFERFSARLKGDYQLNKWLKLGANIGFTHYISDRLEATNSIGSSGNIFATADFIAPIYPIYVRDKDRAIISDKYGFYRYDFGVSKDYPGLKQRPHLPFSNPMGELQLDKNNNRANIVSIRSYADFSLLKGLKLTLNMGYDSDDTYHLNKSNPLYGQSDKSQGTLYREFNRTTSINLQQLLTYNRSFGKHHLDLLVGHEYYKKRYEELSGSKKTYYRIDETELNGAILEPNAKSHHDIYATEGYLGRLQYDWASKYFFSASFRRDASSKFHKDHRWGTFWSLGGSWLINKEQFMSSLKFVNLLKLKFSYGEQGNDNISDFLYLDLYALKNSNDAFSTSFYRKGNKNLTWETSANINAGLEFALFNERLRGGVDVYTREVRDMLFDHTVPKSAGYNNYKDNLGAMRNRGIELELTAVALRKKHATWTLTLNAAYNENTFTKLPEEWTSVEGGYRNGSKVYRIGGSIYDRAYPKYLGVNEVGLSQWQTYDKETKTYGKTTNFQEALKDENRVIYTDLRPMWNGGFSTNLELYDFELSASLSFALGGRKYDGGYEHLSHGMMSGATGRNIHKDLLNSWTPENKNTNIPRLNYGGIDISGLSDRFVVSRSYLALNNLTLSYNLPKKFIENLGISKLNVYLAGDNLALLSARKGFDPRFGDSVGYKAMRTYSLGIKVNL